MKRNNLILFIIFFCATSLCAQQTLNIENSPIEDQTKSNLLLIESEYAKQPQNSELAFRYGVALVESNVNPELSKKLLEQARKANIKQANEYLITLALNEFDYELAEQYYEDRIKTLLRKSGKTKAMQEDDVEKVAELKCIENRIAQVRRMLNRVENTIIIDSVIVEKDKILDAYNLSPQLGRLVYGENIMKDAYPQSTAYLTPDEEILLYVALNEKNETTIFRVDKINGVFSEKSILSVNNFGSEGGLNYPFLFPDGITLTFAQQDICYNNDNYNIYMTRYNFSSNDFLKPDLIPYPYNSNADNYLYVVDDIKGVGWFATNRNTTKDKVCVYTFKLNSKPDYLTDEVDENIRMERSRISSIRKTWDANSTYNDLILNAKSRDIKFEIEPDFNFELDDNITLNKLSDFKNIKARDIFLELQQKKKLLDNVAEMLAYERESFDENTSSKSSKEKILKMEKDELSLQDLIRELENKLRIAELEH